MSATERNRLIGIIFRSERDARGLSQGEVAKSLHISLSYYGKLETGRRPFGIDHIHALCDVLDVPLDRRHAVWALVSGEDFIIATGTPGPLSPGMLNVMHTYPGPAFVHQTPIGNILACNQPAKVAFPWLDPDQVDTGGRPLNLIVQMLNEPRARTVLPGWFTIVHRMVYALRHHTPGLVPSREVQAIRFECRAHPEFEEMWNRPLPTEVYEDDNITVLDPATGRRAYWQYDRLRFIHPFRDGELFLLTPKPQYQPPAKGTCGETDDEGDLYGILMW
ncbi:helix-turn-helix domain-containing protein [Nocardia niigatensis]